ncbi:hypothetical protein R3P38DRAFT_3001621 [Favolaschia claudopus]|uniref:MYND-type domain-containing protein n=1 Tax=Favolaschia claudopus TaxID=2862362 RepID=A0AAW0ANS0_9AGAR
MDIQQILNVTPESLVTWAGVLEGDLGNLPDSVREARLSNQLAILQSQPIGAQMKTHSQVAAKYLPSLIDLYRERDQVISSASTLINVITASPYFVRFLRTPGGNGIAALQTKRAAASIDQIDTTFNADSVAEIFQFLGTLLLLQGVQDVAPEDKAILLRHLPNCERKFVGRLASETAGRCMALLSDDPYMRPMMQEVKRVLEQPLEQCGGPGCTLRVQKNGAELSQCSRCKSAVYCGADHQKAAWAKHKPTCFAPTF